MEVAGGVEELDGEGELGGADVGRGVGWWRMHSGGRRRVRGWSEARAVRVSEHTPTRGGSAETPSSPVSPGRTVVLACPRMDEGRVW